jgi:hypothetical protein
MNNDPIARLKTPETCEQFAINVEERGKPELAVRARRKAVELRAAEHGENTDAEREALEATYAYYGPRRFVKGQARMLRQSWSSTIRSGHFADCPGNVDQ